MNRLSDVAIWLFVKYRLISFGKNLNLDHNTTSYFQFTWFQNNTIFIHLLSLKTKAPNRPLKYLLLVFFLRIMPSMNRRGVEESSLVPLLNRKTHFNSFSRASGHIPYQKLHTLFINRLQMVKRAKNSLVILHTDWDTPKYWKGAFFSQLALSYKLCIWFCLS